ncbi:MAG: hypothetical protein ACYCX4_10555 [Bacillota bacterium]
MAKQWPSLFRDMPVLVQVDAKIPREALFARPLQSEKTPRAADQE